MSPADDIASSSPTRLMTAEGSSIADPTPLTTAMLIRELANLREILETRLDAMDKAIDLLAQYPTRMDEKVFALRDLTFAKIETQDTLFHEKFDSVQTQLHERDDKFATLRELFDEKFRGVASQFRERDTRTDQQMHAAAEALAAALSAAKEAVGKNESATDRRIIQLEQLISEKSKTSDDKIADVKDRLTRIEGRGEGTSVTSAIQRTQSEASQQRVLTIGGWALVVVMAFIGYAVQGNLVRTAKNEEQLADVLRSRDERSGVLAGLKGDTEMAKRELDTVKQRVSVLEQARLLGPGRAQ